MLPSRQVLVRHDANGCADRFAKVVRGGPDVEGFRVLLESSNYFLDLQVAKVDEPGEAYVYLIRKDGRLPRESESDDVFGQLLGPEVTTMPYARVVVQYGPGQRPQDYKLAEPPTPGSVTPRHNDHLALEMSLRYPPDSNG